MDAPNSDTMEELMKRFFLPLLKGWYARYGHHFNTLGPDYDDAEQEAIIQCVVVFDKYDPSRGTAMNFFTRVIQWVFEGYRDKKDLHDRRFITEADLVTDDE